MPKTPIWQRKAGKSPSGGLNAAGRKSAGVGAPVTEDKPKGKRKSRKKAFCARMRGMKKKLTGAKKKRDPNSRINKSLRKWKCEDGCVLTPMGNKYYKQHD